MGGKQKKGKTGERDESWQVTGPLPLNLNTKEAWVGQGRRGLGVAQDQGVFTH